MEKISHDELLSILSYDENTGNFIWIKPRPKIRVGEKAGHLHSRGYVYLEIYGKHYAAHRLAWFYITKEWPINQVDHINMVKSDNRFCNLRQATNGQNMSNRKVMAKSNLKGVVFLKWMKEKPWKAQITHNKKVHYLGCFKTKEEAHSAYCAAAIKLHGDFARL